MGWPTSSKQRSPVRRMFRSVQERDAVGVFARPCRTRSLSGLAPSEPVQKVRPLCWADRPAVRNRSIVRFAGDDARQAEHAPRRIVRVNRHADAGLLRHRDDRFQERLQGCFHSCSSAMTSYWCQQVAQLGSGVAFVPAGERQLAGQRVHRAVRLRRRTPAHWSRRACCVLQLAAQPVEHGHEVVANAL